MPKFTDDCSRAGYCDDPKKSGCGEFNNAGKWQWVHKPDHDKGCHQACKGPGWK